MINFYRCFLSGIAKTLHPLTDALAGNPQTLPWSEELQAAFTKAKSTLAFNVSLTHPAPSTEISLDTDASALQQQESGGWRPLAFFSAKLSAT